MGYITYAHGEIAIEPPLAYPEVHGSPFLPEVAEHEERDVMFRIETQAVETADGTLSRIWAMAIVQTWEDEPRNYNIIEHLQELVDRHGQGRDFVGQFDMEGEDAGDIWRLKIVNGKATRIDPVITWPEASA